MRADEKRPRSKTSVSFFPKGKNDIRFTFISHAEPSNGPVKKDRDANMSAARRTPRKRRIPFGYSRVPRKRKDGFVK